MKANMSMLAEYSHPHCESQSGFVLLSCVPVVVLDAVVAVLLFAPLVLLGRLALVVVLVLVSVIEACA
jgi:hypothetical protein